MAELKPCIHCNRWGHYPYQCTYRPAKASKPCKFCGSKLHLSWQCYNNPNRSIQIKTKLKNSKTSMIWTKARRKWFRAHPADWYNCYLCGKILEPRSVTLDHVIPRSRAPHLRYDMANLKPCCWSCNTEKGSKVYNK